jgi:DNA-binding response OmpR family regulator
MTMTNNKRVLVIEDEPSISTICKRVLTTNGYVVDTALDGELAEQEILKIEYDIILCDIRLPVISGIEFYIWLKQEYPEMARRVIFMTGSVMGGEAVNFLEKSGRPYLLKPFRPEELLDIITKNV